MTTAYEYQAEGFCSTKKNHTEALSEANKQLADAKAKTPAHLRELFRGSIRFNKLDSGYDWFWILK